MKISKEDVKYIENLARLKIDEDKLDKLTEDLQNIVTFAEQLNEIDVTGVEETAHILDINNVYRKDEVKPSFERNEILKNAKEKEVGCVVVPKTVD